MSAWNATARRSTTHSSASSARSARTCTAARCSISAAVVVLIVAAVLLLLAVGGYFAQRRRLAASESAFRTSLEQADQDLAAAHAEDNGWDRERLEAAARRVFSEQHPGHAIDSLALVQVVDKPGTEADEAVFLVDGGGHQHRVVLGRAGEDWVAGQR